MNQPLSYPIDFKWRPEFATFCKKRKIFLKHRWLIDGVYKPGDVVRLTCPVFVEKYGTMVQRHFFSTGAFSYATTFLPNSIKLGRYCSVAAGVEVMAAQHPMGRFTTSPITYLPIWERFARDEFGSEWTPEIFDEMPPPPIVGNDVWIGQGALIKGGITIGHGACIAARAVVTRDVPPYSIVGGCPARVIRYRFPEEIIERLLTLQWWNYKFTDLPRCDYSDIDLFLNSLAAKIEDGAISIWTPEVWDIGAEFANIESSLPQG